MRTILYILIISALLVSCKSKKEVVKEETKTEVQEEMSKKKAMEEAMKNEQIPNEAEEMYKAIQKEIPANVVARIQRTACFGRCPIYYLNVYDDGSAEYVGRKWVDKEGTYTAQVSEDKMKALMNRSEEVDFMNFQTIYDKQGITDLPSVITSIRKGDVLKTVVNRYGGPQELSDFENFIDDLFTDLNWEKKAEE